MDTPLQLGPRRVRNRVVPVPRRGMTSIPRRGTIPRSKWFSWWLSRTFRRQKGNSFNGKADRGLMAARGAAGCVVQGLPNNPYANHTTPQGSSAELARGHCVTGPR
jgi:hypothetical protein